MTRATRATIDLNALRHNLDIARQIAPNSKQLAVIKANAYGHGILSVARSLEKADALAVACVDEAVQLRDAGINKPVVILEGFYDRQELEVCRRYELIPMLHQLEQLDLLEMEQGDPVSVWLKIDTGMHRLGIRLEQSQQVWRRLLQCKAIKQQSLVLASHLANADDRSDERTLQQFERFQQLQQRLTAPLPFASSLANSGGLLGWPQTRMDWVRPGIMLYGVSPFRQQHGSEHGLQPVMTLRSRLIAINYHRRGDAIGYGGRWCCPEDMPVGVVAIGYGDGYPRHATSGTPVLINGQRVPLVGRVSMDMLTVDLRGRQDVRLGDEVILWGEGLPVEEVAQYSDTIAYDLLCGINPRVSVHH